MGNKQVNKYKLKGVDIQVKINKIMQNMTVKEKIGQLQQISYYQNYLTQQIKTKIIMGQVGSIFNCIDVNLINQMQSIAINKSPNSIPLLIARDVIHGFRTILPIPLAQAASFNPAIVKAGARIAAIQASSIGIKWTFSPMVDIARDPRWGRIAQGFGEDPYLSGVMGSAVVLGYQTNDLSDITAIAACAKHYVGYGAAQGGKDYNTTLIPQNTLRDIYLQPFKSVVNTGILTIMSAFNDLNGVPSTGNQFTLKKILRDQWNFQGIVVSDYTAVQQMIVHGFCQNRSQAALKSFNNGVDMEMVSTCMFQNLEDLINKQLVSMQSLDRSVSNILMVKQKLNLFQNYYTDPSRQQILLNPKHLKTAQQLATECPVLLQNKKKSLPFSKNIKNLAVIGPFADDQQNQLGCNVADGKSKDVITPFTTLKQILVNTNINYSKGIPDARSYDKSLFSQAIQAANKSDLILLFLGEDNGLTGQSCSRAILNLPGCQQDLIIELSKINKPIVLILYAGRPIILTKILPLVDSLLFVWHLGTMSGPSIVDLLIGNKVPSGKLPLTYMRQLGQIPTYYNKKNTGRPNDSHQYKQSTSSYLDIDPTPLYPFGYGLSYANFIYSNLKLSKSNIYLGQQIDVEVRVANTTNVVADQIIMLFVWDLFGSYTRPVKQLKKFIKITFTQYEQKLISFKLSTNDLRFWSKNNKFQAQIGKFIIYVGKNSNQLLDADLMVSRKQNDDQQFEII